MYESADEKTEFNKSCDKRINSSSNLSFSRIFSGLLKEDQRNSSKIPTSPP